MTIQYSTAHNAENRCALSHSTAHNAENRCALSYSTAHNAENRCALSVKLSILILVAAPAFVSAQALGVKPGQWETTTNMSTPGGAPAIPQLPPGALDRLPPEQRARVEAQLKAAGGGGRTTTSTRCVTADDAAKGFQPGNLPQACTYNLTVSTPKQQKMTVTCTNDKVQSTGTVQVDVVDSENIKGSVQMAAATPAGQTMNSTITFTSKWVGPACTDKK